VTREAARQIYTAGQRASSLTRQLLYFSRRRPIEQTSLDLNQTIEEVATMLRRLIGENIDLKLELTPKLGPISADVSMMEQVLVNLTVNARDAMPQGGRLTVSTELVDLSATDVRGHSEARPGRFVRLRVQDTGCGISKENLNRIFEPFFTTKEVGKGTGLGLATVFGIIKQHHGWLDVESQVGVGTLMSAHLPIAPDSELASPKSVPVSGSVVGGRETILIVEDETSVREFAVAVLQPLGYRLLQARSGRDALEVWKWHGSRIQLLLTDMVMPDELTGPQLADKLVAAKPELAVIFTSGYSQEMADRVFPSGRGARFINKPYSPRQLGTLVREALDARPSRTPQRAPLA
jgi:CheY-like chemotaxis protein